MDAHMGPPTATPPQDLEQTSTRPNQSIAAAGVGDTRSGIQTDSGTAAFFLLALFAVAASAMMLYPFLPAITGTAIVAVITRRAFRWCRRITGSSNVAASSAVVVVTVSIVAPVFLLGQYMARQAILGVQMLQDGRGRRALDEVLERFPRIAQAVENSSEFVTLGDALQQFGGFAASYLLALVSNSLAAVSQTLIMLFLLFFFYRDEEVVTRFFSSLLPLSSSEKTLLVKRLEDTLRATVLGRIAVAAIQGAVAAGIFAALGVRAAVIFGLLTSLLGLVPPFGPYLVWLPVAVWFGVSGHWVKMAILLASGTLIVSTLDNFLYPVLVGARLRRHTAVMFLSLLGGIWAFGIAGLVLGPLIVTTAEAFLEIWRERSGAEAV